MLSRIFARRPRPEPVAPEVPAGSRVYAIGDIHGRADLLRQLHGLIRDDAAQSAASRKVVVYLGDYVDRGERSREVIDLLLAGPPAGFEAVYLRGNHEQSMLRFLEDIEIGQSWMAYGGNATLFSYGVQPPMPASADFERAQAALRERLPEPHRRFLESLVLSHDEGDYHFVHAGVRPGIPLPLQIEDDVLWIRDEFLSSSADHGKIIVHGHTISERPEIRPNRIGIDTGAFASGRLTALVLEGKDWSFLQT